jgi:hypothetical protein
MVTEQVKDYTHLDAKHKGVFGQMVYSYQSPTHWNDGICEIRVVFYGELKAPEVSFNYGCGGWNSGFSHAEIAEAMSEAFALATHRLRVIEQCPWQCKP